ncbi:MAG: DUF2334 domain-containing protein [Gemmatimonadaceae bacterium]
MKLLVAIHDVTPAFAAQITRLWELCTDRGVCPALFVVPRWHGGWPLARYPDFVQWLRDRQGAGAEIFLHGDRHDEAGLTRDWRATLRALGRTDREGEFLTLTRAEAARRIARGLFTLRMAGLSPVGFVAPAWLTSEDALHAVAASGLRFGEDQRSVHLYTRHTRIASPVVRWSARAPWRAHMSAAVAAAHRYLHRDAALLRIALHPADLEHPATERSLRATLDAWRAERLPHRYAEL